MNLKSIVAQFLSFQPGYRLIDGGELKILAEEAFSYRNGLAARAGGGQTGATPLPAAINEISTVVTAADSVMLPLAIPGKAVTVINSDADSVQVFGQPTNPNTGVGDTVAAYNSNTQQATATGVAHAGQSMSRYVCWTAGKWKQGYLG